MWVRPAAVADRNRVAELAAADRPSVLSVRRTAASGTAAYEGRQCVLVAHDGSGQVVGAMALDRHPGPGSRAGELMWLHCRENPVVAAALLRTALERSAGLGTVTAFGRATPWPPHLPGVPLHNRPVTTEALAAAGFRTRHQWLLLHRPVAPVAPVAAVAPVTRVAPGERGATGGPSACPVPWITPDGTLHSTSAVPRPSPPADARQHLLHRSLAALDRAGVCEALATVDLLEPDAPAQCGALGRAGFEEVDLLRSFVLA
ncbi:hypothetical protein SAMN05216371_7453 [Streptomyces sp. TLI_053]|uniref:hypothetical protein n=1 Tax=Streptomyces sp. TLI_053 TaxID=1855352 RepID=UPI000879E76C|nr:hypothetical protein [Streptomyces sp. TLI_053]SDT82663.1 hypothetical protein SAMN05216371_7453 [Streptomyces sp. TLI_053]